MKKAIYAFSGDPITFGHIDIIQRASHNFDEVIVGIGSNPDKLYTFSLEERTKMALRSLKGVKNVKVRSFRGLLVDYTYEQNISVIVKGVRNSADFDYENILHQVGESQKLGIDTFILFARPNLTHVSSSAVKSIQKEHGFIHEYVPLYVKQRLEINLSKQFIIGVTGEIGSGKSFVTNQLLHISEEKEIEAYIIDLDDIGHQILENLTEPKYEMIRRELISEFGQNIKTKEGMIKRKALGKIVFNNSNALKKLNKLMLNPILVRLKRELYGKKGLIILNGALLAEANMINLCNNNVILVKCDKKIQEERLLKRGLKKSQIKRRILSQYSFQDKKNIIDTKIKYDNQGKLWIVNNSGLSLNKKLNSILSSIVNQWKKS